MSGRECDRHKGPRNYQTGSEKRKIAKEKQKQHDKVLSQTPRLSDFFLTTSTSISQDTETKKAIAFEEDSTEIIKDNEAENNETNVDGVINIITDKTENELNTQNEIFSKTDIGLWTENIKDVKDLILHWLKSESDEIRNCDPKLLKENSFKQEDSYFSRTCQISMFEKKLKNGEVIKREWLCFSPSDGKLYCLICKLFSDVETQFSHGGFCDWKNASNRLISHETSSAHLKALITFNSRSKELGRIDFEVTQQIENERQYWRKVLNRIASVICFISERGLSFRGRNEDIGSPHNGNYLGLLELLAQYDEFLAEHIKTHANRGQGHVNYLSSTICNDVRRLIAQRVFNEIITRVKKSKYFSFTLDSTKDVGRIDQLVLILRYVEENGDPVERFLTFMPNQGHKAQDMFDGLMNFLKTNDLNIKNCRAQSYDNASVMSGKYEGLQALVRKENELAFWVPCFGHSLNLVGTDAMNSCTEAKLFFSFLEQIYNFFTVSADRYKRLVECLKLASSKNNPLLVPKRVSTTRWSSRVDATNALVRGYPQIKQILSEMAEENSEANGLFHQICKLETAIYAVFWNEILNRVNSVSKTLQSPKTDLNTSVALIKSLQSFIQTKRESYSEYERQASLLCETNEYTITNKRKRIRNVRLNELDCTERAAIEFTPADAFWVQSFLPVIDQFIVSLTKRISAYSEIHNLFGFLEEFNNLNSDEIMQHARVLCGIYKNDLDENLGIELVHFKEFCNEFMKEKEEDITIELFMFKLLIEKNVKYNFSNVETLFKIYFCIITTNCTGERSFSKLKLIKDNLSTSMTQENLTDRTILSTEYDLLRNLNISEIIDDFADQKARKKFLIYNTL